VAPLSATSPKHITTNIRQDGFCKSVIVGSSPKLEMKQDRLAFFFGETKKV